jgi:4-hydroxy-4-methyl-2-oxoglutarate aldolase
MSGRIAPWGELLSTAARARGAAGCLTDGLVRDTRAIRKMVFPVFHGGIRLPQEPRSLPPFVGL